MDQLRYIRETMESSTSFTAVPGWGGIAMGFSALAAAAVAEWSPLQAHGIWVWLTDAGIALLRRRKELLARNDEGRRQVDEGDFRDYDEEAKSPRSI